MAYIGAVLKISQEAFFLILGVTLIIAAVLLWMKTETKSEETISEESKSSVAGNSF